MDIIKEMMDLGLGAVLLTEKKAKKLVNELIKKGKLKQKEGKNLMDELIKKGKAEGKDFERRLAQIISAKLSKLDIATKADIRRLENEIKKIKKTSNNR